MAWATGSLMILAALYAILSWRLGYFPGLAGDSIRETARLPGRYGMLLPLVGTGRTLMAAALRDTLVLLDMSRPEALRRAAALPLGADLEDVAQDGHRLCVTTRKLDLRIFSLVDPLRPTEIGRIDSVGLSRALEVRDGLAYFLEYLSGLTLLRVGGPGRPEILGRLELPGAAHLALHGKSVLVARGDHPVARIDISDPRRPRLADSLPVRTHHPIAVLGGMAFIADWEGVLWRKDLSDEGPGGVLSRVEGFGRVNWAHALGAVLCVRTEGRLRFLDATDPLRLVFLDETLVSSKTYALARVGEYVYFPIRVPRALVVTRVPALRDRR